MKFKYKKYGQGFLRPVVPLLVKNKDYATYYEVLIDSGADVCIFGSDIAEILGIDLFSGHKGIVMGVTGEKEDCYVHDIEIEIGGHNLKIPVCFLLKMSDSGHGIVGQIGFFDNFIVKFDLLKEEIELKERFAGG